MPFTVMKSEKKAVLGGTFDPVHMGHINLFHSVNDCTDITTLYVIPAYVSNFKRERHTASFDDRMAMLNLAVLDYSDLYPLDELNIVVSDWEGRKKGVSYTSDTIRALMDELGDGGKVNFIIGDDLIDGLPAWHDSTYIRDHVRFYCFVRDLNYHTVPDGYEIHFVESVRTEASSTRVREGDFSSLSESVREYIEENGLYGAEVKS